LHENEILEIKADAYFDGYFKSISESSSSDTLIVDILSYVNYNTSYFVRTYFGKGIHKWKTSPYRGIGDKYLRFKLDYTRNNQWHTKIDSVFIKSHETYRDTIYY
jgi:hypothetical protein